MRSFRKICLFGDLFGDHQIIHHHINITKMKNTFYLSLLLLLTPFVQAQQSDVEKFLSGKSGLTVETIEAPGSQFEKGFLIFIEQPLDHKHPEKGVFKQRIWLSVKDTVNAHPVVMITEGYAANRNYNSELSRLLNSNQIIVEHRYFSESTPDSLDWQYLTVEQAANDHHRIIELFKPFFTGKWITTGISKGGQTAIYHRAFFPDDVDVTVPYVAPINFGREEQRLFDFFHKVGTEQERDEIRQFQKTVLERRDVMMVKMKVQADEKKWTFRMGFDKAFDLAVLEYPFSFWQWGHDVSIIPDSTASDQDLFNHLIYVSDFSYECDQEWGKIKSFFYQAYTELGYYAYVPGELKPLIKGFDRDTISSDLFVPGRDILRYHPETMQFVMAQLKKHNPKIIAISGENDPWGSTSLIVDDISNAYLFFKPGGCHKTRIRNLPAEMKEEIFMRIEEWTGVKIVE